MPQSLTILLHEEDLRCVEALRPAALRGTVLAFSLDLHLALKDRGMAHITPWDVVRAHDRDAVHALDREVWRFWTNHARIMDQGMDLLAMTQYRHVQAMSQLAWMSFVIDRALEHLTPTEVVTFEEPVGHGLEQPPGLQKLPLLFALLRGMAEQAGIETTILRRSDAPGQEPFIDHAAAAAVKHFDPVSLEALLRGRPYVLFQANGADLLRQLQLIEAIHRDGEIAMVQAYTIADQRTLDRLESIGHIVLHESQLAPRSMPATISDTRARERFDHARRQAPPVLQGIFNNAYVDIHFDFIFGEYARKMAGHVRRWTKFFHDTPPSAVIVNSQAALCDVAHHHGIPCALLSHGPAILGSVRWYEAFPPVSIAAISRPHRARLLEAGIPNSRIHITGDPALDELFSESNKPRISNGNIPRQVESPVTDHHEKMVLLLTAAISAPVEIGVIPTTNWLDAAACIDELGAMMVERTGWRFTIKCHPRYDHRAMYERLLRRLPRQCKVTMCHDVPLRPLVEAADVVVAFNTASSSLVDASFLNKPVIRFDRSMMWFDDEANEMHRWPRVRSVPQLRTALDAVLSDESRRQRLIAQTREALHGYYGGSLEPALPRCVDLVQRLAAGPTACSDNISVYAEGLEAA